jgi:hypothetical protein
VQQVITPPDSPSDLGALAMDGSSLVVGDPFNDDQASNNGSLYLIKKVALSLPFQAVAVKGDFAPGTPDTTFSSFSEVDFNSSLAFTTGLAGPGSGGGKDKAVWRDNGTPNRQMKSRTPLLPQPAPTVASVSMPLLKGFDSLSEPDINETVIFRAILSGNGVSKQNNQAIFRALIGGPDAPSILFRTGTHLPTATGTGRKPLGFGQLSVPQTKDQIVFAARQAPDPAVPIDTSNDSALFWYNNGNVASLPVIPAVPPSLTVIAEGNGTPLGTLGEMTGHFAFQKGELLFSAALTSGAATQNQGLFRQTSPGAIVTGLATKGLDLVPDSDGNGQPGITFSSFLAESLDNNENGVIRAMIQGSGITKANNEGLWKAGPGTVGQRLAQKGNPINGATVAGFKAFWSTANQCLIWLKLSGPGVSAANNEALVVVQTGGALDGEPLVLLRKGDSAPGYSPAKIGNIVDVEVEANGGQYIVLTTLTGAPATKNLALFRGQSATTAASANHSVLRKPVPVLRKGELFDNQPSPVKSISIRTNSRTPGGAGCVGLASTINGAAANSPTQIAFVLTYENGNTRLVRGSL